MSRVPADRYPSVADLRAALEDHIAHRASVRLATDAEARLDELEKRAAALGDDPVPREELQELFGQCRFGFVHALSTWPDNEKARVGLDRALVAMARSELARGQAGAARTVLAEAHSVPDELRDAIEAALQKEEQERSMLEELERQRREMDPSVGRTQRALFSAVLGGSVCFGPLIAIARERMGHPQAHDEVLFWPWVMGAFVSVVSWIFRRALLRTALNRRLMGMLVGSMLALGLFHIGAKQAGLDLPTIQALDFALFAGVGVLLAVLVDRRLLFASAVFLGGFFVATARPDLRYWLLFVANLSLIANFLWLWPPWRPDPEESADTDP